MEPLIQNEEIVENVDFETNNSDEKSARNLDGKFTPFFVICLLIAVLGGSFQFGWNIGVFNVPEKVIKSFYLEVYAKNNNQTMSSSTLNLLWSITNGLLPLGGLFGGFSSGFVADLCGRKSGILYTNALVLIAAALNIMSKFIPSYETLMAGRFVAGLFCGLFSGLVPMYLNELAPNNLKGLAGTMNQLFLVGGIMITNIFGLPEIFGSENLWPILVGFLLLPLVIHSGLLFAVETPKYLYIKNRKEEARAALVKLRGSSASQLVENEIQELEDEKQKLLAQKDVSWGDLFRERHLFRPLIVTIVIQMSQQLSGINAVIFYSSNIFSTIVSPPWPSYITIIIAMIQFVMTLVCMAIVDKAGRKILLLVGMIGMCVSAFVIGVAIIVNKDSSIEWLSYLTIAAVMIYIIFFSIGPGAIPWLITSELFASDARGKATSVAVLTNWFSNFLVTLLFPIVNEAIGAYTFLIFGNFLILFSLFMFFFVPETKNKSSDDIIALFKNRFVFVR